MRWMIVPVVFCVTACGQMSAPRTEDSMALAQTKSAAWQDKDGKALSAAQVEHAYRACQSSTFGPSRSFVAMNVPLEDEHSRLALTDSEFNVCMQSFGYRQADSPTDMKPGGED
jgi:hypothetical protein